MEQRMCSSRSRPPCTGLEIRTVISVVNAPQLQHISVSRNSNYYVEDYVQAAKTWFVPVGSTAHLIHATCQSLKLFASMIPPKKSVSPNCPLSSTVPCSGTLLDRIKAGDNPFVRLACAIQKLLCWELIKVWWSWGVLILVNVFKSNLINFQSYTVNWKEIASPLYWNHWPGCQLNCYLRLFISHPLHYVSCQDI